MNRKDRRAKAKKNIGVDTTEPGFWSNMHTYQGHPDGPPPEIPIPGIDIPPIDAMFNEKVARNSWHPKEEFDSFVDFIKTNAYEKVLSGPLIVPIGTPEELKDPKWSWAYNSDCKYVTLHVDMRDGGFTVMNQNGDRINLDQLKWQWKSQKE